MNIQSKILYLNNIDNEKFLISKNRKDFSDLTPFSSYELYYKIERNLEILEFF